MQILHRCDTPSCVNPHHLFFGTVKDNVRDSINKNRWPRGENHHAAKLTASDVSKILKDTRLQKIIAQEFGVKRITISTIKNRRIWKHII